MLERWLHGKTASTGMAIATRSALRVLPLLAQVSATREISSADTLQTFRLAAAAWASLNFPSDRLIRVTHAAIEFNHRFSQTGDTFPGLAQGAAYAAAVCNSGNLGESWPQFAATTAFSVSEVWSTIEADCNAIESGIDPIALTAGPLWPGNIPDWAAEIWSRLKRALIKRPEVWHVWIDWYEARLSGQKVNSALEIARLAEIPEGEWELAPTIVNTHIRDIIARFEDRELTPVEGIPSSIDFKWSGSSKKIEANPSKDFKPEFSRPIDKSDHKERLSLCRTIASELIDEIDRGRFNIRSDDYRYILFEYINNIPTLTTDHNILSSDHFARLLRSMFAEEVSILPLPFAIRLKSLLETHQSIRVFYPSLQRFYDAVRLGRIEEPLPVDAISGIAKIVSQETDIFDQSVSDAFGGLSRGLPSPPVPPLAAPDSTQLQPPADPIGNVPVEKARDYERASIANRLWAIFSKGAEVQKNADAWNRTFQKLSPHIEPMLSWLRQFVDSGNGSQ